jgi:hypothetical protein
MKESYEVIAVMSFFLAMFLWCLLVLWASLSLRRGRNWARWAVMVMLWLVVLGSLVEVLGQRTTGITLSWRSTACYVGLGMLYAIMACYLSTRGVRNFCSAPRMRCPACGGHLRRITRFQRGRAPDMCGDIAVCPICRVEFMIQRPT